MLHTGLVSLGVVASSLLFPSWNDVVLFLTLPLSLSLSLGRVYRDASRLVRGLSDDVKMETQKDDAMKGAEREEGRLLINEKKDKSTDSQYKRKERRGRVHDGWLWVRAGEGGPYNRPRSGPSRPQDSKADTSARKATADRCPVPSVEARSLPVLRPVRV